MMSRPAPRLRPPSSQQFQFGPWTITSTHSHILESEGADRAKFESRLQLPQLPEMIFAENKLHLQHEAGFGIEFSALDALAMVDAHTDPLKVAASEEWQNARSNCEHIKNVVKPYDWTYSTDYKGSVFSASDKPGFEVSSTTDRIDIEKLKVREKIIFFDEILLFEDELSDNGTSILSVKIRVMPSGFFVLQRFFMRVDNVIVRVNDTRVYHETGKNYILREYSSRDDKIEDLAEIRHLLNEPNEIGQHISLRSETFEKIEFSPKAALKNEKDTTGGST